MVRLETVATRRPSACWTTRGRAEISDLVSLKINKFTDEFAAYLRGEDLFDEKNKKLLQVLVD